MAKRKRDGVMLAKPFDAGLWDKFPNAVLYQPKLNGIRLRAVWSEGEYHLYSSTGREVNSLPHINSQLTVWAAMLEAPPTLDGEAYTHGVALQEINSVVSRRRNIHPEFERVEYHIFDTINNNEQQHERLYWLGVSLFDIGADIKEVLSTLGTKADLQELLTQYMEQGYEGVICRHPNALYTFGKQSCILKLKPFHTDEYKILNCQEAISEEGEPKGMVGAFDLVDSVGNHFQASAGRLDHSKRRMWWAARNRLPGRICVVKYHELTNRGVPREPVTIEIKGG